MLEEVLAARRVGQHTVHVEDDRGAGLDGLAVPQPVVGGGRRAAHNMSR
jgi:hypothetical protein